MYTIKPYQINQMTQKKPADNNLENNMGTERMYVRKVNLPGPCEALACTSGLNCGLIPDASLTKWVPPALRALPDTFISLLTH